MGSRLGEAEALNNLGELSLKSVTPADALQHYDRALAIAKEVASLSDSAAGAARLLRQSLAIYQRIGSPNAQRVNSALCELDG
jgi:hypothetical protein